MRSGPGSARPVLPGKRCRQLLSLLPVLVPLAVPASPAPDAAVGQDGLRAYVQRPDPSTAWSLRSQGRYRDADYLELKLQSQTWRGIPWKHQVFMIRPGQVDPGRPALLFIAGGRWMPQYDGPRLTPGMPERTPVYVALARRLRAPVAVLLQVPHQPILDGLTEDALIAHSMARYVETRDPDWPVLLPMTKAATAAMDAVQAAAREHWGLETERFVVTGASKRGWTAWLTAAVDPRVVAVAPMVFDVLDMRRQMAHQQATWGGASGQIRDYQERDLPRLLRTPVGDALLDLVDPWRHRERLHQPKLVILSTNDPYWPVDSAGIYFDGLPEPRNLLYLPNNAHTPTDFNRLLSGIVALQRSVAAGETLPVVEGRHSVREGHAELTITTGQAPRRVRAWYARSDSREFRQARWLAKAARPDGNGGWRFRVPLEGKGYVALLGEAEFDDGRGRYYLSTALRILGPAGVEPLAADPGVTLPDPRPGVYGPMTRR
jgi:PhoPQ-activated pathogenicity-related protein